MPSLISHIIVFIFGAVFGLVIIGLMKASKD